MQTPAPSQPIAKRFKHEELKSGGQKGPQCNKFGKLHEGFCCVVICYNYDKEGHFNRYYK